MAIVARHRSVVLRLAAVFTCVLLSGIFCVYIAIVAPRQSALRNLSKRGIVVTCVTAEDQERSLDGSIVDPLRHSWSPHWVFAVKQVYVQEPPRLVSRNGGTTVTHDVQPDLRLIPCDSALARYIVGVGGVRKLVCRRVSFTSAGPTLWSNLSGIEEVHCYACQGIESARMADLTRLRIVVLVDSCICDQDISALTTLPACEVLNLRDNAITDASVPWLCSMPTLKRLDLRGTRVSRVGFRQLRSRLGGCVVLQDSVE